MKIVRLYCALALLVCISVHASECFENYNLGYDNATDAKLQAALEKIDTDLRVKFGINPEQTSCGVLDLKTCRLATVRPDRGDYAASVAKVGILLAYFQTHPEAATNIDPVTKHELGLMAKVSSNEMAAKYSRLLELTNIQAILNKYDLYNTNHGGGIWMGRHYGGGGERIGDPLGDNSHAATVRQLLRYFLWLEQGKLVSPAASKTMRDIFASPDVPHDDIKFVKGLAGRNVQIIRKWGTWQDWFHDSAIITGPNRHYILVAMTKHPKGDEYLVALAQRIDDIISSSK
jgi:beta-lactamase class A